MGGSEAGLSRRACLLGLALPTFFTHTAQADRMRSVDRDIAAPQIDLPLLGGGDATLDLFLSKPVIVAFWATWCAPCRAELPALARVHAQKKIGVLAINAGENESRIIPFLQQVGVENLPVPIDPARKAMVAWRVTALPAAYIVGPDRRIRYSVLGEIDWESDSVQRRILALEETGRSSG